MGEKYDSCYYDYGYGQPQLQARARRLTDPSGPGFPPEQYAEMRRWDEQGKVALSNYLDRPAATIGQVAGQAREQLQAAGTDPGARLAAGQQAVDTLNEGFERIQLQSSQGNMALSMLDHEPNVPTGELAQVMRGSARKAKQAVGEHLGLVDQAIHDVLGTAQDMALNALGAQGEAAIDRIGRAVYAGAANLSNEMLRRGMGDVPGTTGATA
jgi:hypothetical protein